MTDYITSLPAPPVPPSGKFLHVHGTDIVNEDGQLVLLRGCGVGGWMKMENFITGFPGHEVLHRKAMLEALGQEKYDFFFDRFLYHFFNERDARLFQHLGFNCIRLAFDYRHFEDDMNPMVLKPSGFKHLDRVIQTCAEHGIYTILDLHAAPGGQNPSWHSNNVSNHAAFWEHKHFQDRAVWLWETIAARYKDNPWVAGYNPLNEPADGSKGARRLIAWYRQVEQAIRAIDTKHILFWDGNTFAMDWSGFDELEDDGKSGQRKAGVFPNSVYSCHDYSTYGFPRFPRFKDTPEQLAHVQRNYDRKVEFMKKNNLAIWNGEWGPVYANEEDDGPEWQEINNERVALLRRQLEIYSRDNIPWSIWLWKDIGFQGMVYTSKDSPYMKLIHDWLQKKRRLMLDQWGNRPQPDVEALFKPMQDWIEAASPQAVHEYPTTWGVTRHLMRVVREMFLSDSLQGEFASLFKDKSMEELEELAASFSLKENGNGWAVQREYLNAVLIEYKDKKI